MCILGTTTWLRLTWAIRVKSLLAYAIMELRNLRKQQQGRIKLRCNEGSLGLTVSDFDGQRLIQLNGVFGVLLAMISETA